jgi:hypothetical protein
MSKRSDLIGRITTNIQPYATFSISEELPFESGGVPLYEKNLNTVYVDEQQIFVEELYDTLDQGVVNETLTTINAYLSVDAKNQDNNIDTVVANLLISRNVITGTVENTSSYETEIEDDVITYTFEYNFTTV